MKLYERDRSHGAADGACEGEDENPEQTVADMSQLLDEVARTAGRFTLKVCGDVLIDALLRAGY